MKNLKRQKWLKIVELALIILTVLFVILKTAWNGFSYFAFFGLSLCLIFAIIICIFEYVDTKKELKIEYDDYINEKIRLDEIKKEDLDVKNKTFFKEYMKENRWELARYILFFVFCFAVLIMITYAFFHNLTI